jgi:hypothetical protein
MGVLDAAVPVAVAIQRLVSKKALIRHRHEATQVVDREIRIVTLR